MGLSIRISVGLIVVLKLSVLMMNSSSNILLLVGNKCLWFFLIMLGKRFALRGFWKMKERLCVGNRDRI